MRRVAEGVWEITVPEGIHDIEFDPDLAGMENKIIRDVEVVGGGTVEKTLSLGGSGLVRLRVLVDGKPAAGGAYLYHGGRSTNKYTTMRKVAEGVWEITVPEGIHDIEFDPDLAGMENKLIRDVEVVGGSTVEKTLDLGGSGLVRLRVLVDGKPAAGGAYLYHGGRSTNKYTTMRKVSDGVWEITVPEGIHDIEFDPDLAGLDNKLIRDVEVVGGRTVEKTLDLGGSGLVRLRVLLDGKPAAGGAYLYHGGRSTNKYTTMRKVSEGVWEITVPEGVHDIQFDPDLAGLDDQLITGIEVTSKGTVEKTLDLGGSGLLRVNFTYQGQPANASVRVYFGGRATNKYASLRRIQTGVYELRVPAGVHDIEVDPDASGVATQLIRDVEIKGDSVVEKTLSL
ncbi:MAG: hypothetical protein BWY85_01051 [Firmicutes bacterium ADurb.Bin506]|nr:MAG: hypothetical protein BWY85_01051 [Firmicutes bacterium ADurb.Bin506]